MKDFLRYVILFSAIICAIILYTFEYTKKPDLLPKLSDIKITKTEEVFKPGLLDRAVAFASVPSEHFDGFIRRLYPLKPCAMSGGVLPYVWSDWQLPRVGKPLVLHWTTRAARPLANDAAFLIVSLRRLQEPVDMTDYGHTGCHLMVNFDYVLAPVENSILHWKEPGLMELNWIPAEEFVGTTWFLQLLVATDEMPEKWALSPAMEVTIGSRY